MKTQDPDSARILSRYVYLLRDPAGSPKVLIPLWDQILAAGEPALIAAGREEWRRAADELVGDYETWRILGDGRRFASIAQKAGLESVEIDELGRGIHLLARRTPGWTPPDSDYSKIAALTAQYPVRRDKGPDLRSVLGGA